MAGKGIWKKRREQWQSHNLTLFAKTVLILSVELVSNIVIWIITVIVFTSEADKSKGVLSLALVAWTTGLRHGLDADHISGEINASDHMPSLSLTFTHLKPSIMPPEESSRYHIWTLLDSTD